MSGRVRWAETSIIEAEEALRVGLDALQRAAGLREGSSPTVTADEAWRAFLAAADRFVRASPMCLACAQRHAGLVDFEDLVGEFHVHLAERRERVLRLDAERGVGAWFARVFRHRACDVADRARRRRHASLYDEDGALRVDWASAARDPSEDAIDTELRAQRALLFAGLSEREGEALWRRCVEQESYDAIAADLETTRNGAYILVSRAKKTLRGRSGLQTCLE